MRSKTVEQEEIEGSSSEYHRHEFFFSENDLRGFQLLNLIVFRQSFAINKRETDQISLRKQNKKKGRVTKSVNPQIWCDENGLNFNNRKLCGVIILDSKADIGSIGYNFVILKVLFNMRLLADFFSQVVIQKSVVYQMRVDYFFFFLFSFHLIHIFFVVFIIIQ
eukprot:TRINITY_DN179031_c1_g1_i1.p2 TRINITY_DN179031_c1_g1~~TRINITY_DN179031_c1_g1_i1.p2  ORF type:complete len:164 (+),score=5.63 TRINITY_DN179031_c1_g1_i1:391-882(+)